MSMRLGLVALARLHECTDRLGGLVALRLQPLDLADQASPLLVQGKKRVDVPVGVAVEHRGTNGVGVLANEACVEHESLPGWTCGAPNRCQDKYSRAASRLRVAQEGRRTLPSGPKGARQIESRELPEFECLGTLLALAHGYRAQAKAKTGHLLDSAEGYVRSLEELRAQFKEVRRLNIEMEAAQKALLAEMHGRQRAETDLIEAKKLEALGRLAGGIAHDFNNILTVIRVDAKFAREILLKSGDPLKNLDSITEAAERASHLTRRLLTFARRQTVEAREIVLEDYVQQMKDMLAKLAGDQATLEFDLAGEKSTVFIDPGQLEQVLLNLTVNARDAMPHGGWLAFATRRVSLPEKDASVVADLPPGAYVVLTVTDTGIGMGPATLERIFEPFFTTKNARIGTGLGLATSHGIVHQAQGDLRVKSAPGHGTTFFVYLPRQLARHA